MFTNFVIFNCATLKPVIYDQTDTLLLKKLSRSTAPLFSVDGLSQSRRRPSAATKFFFMFFSDLKKRVL